RVPPNPAQPDRRGGHLTDVGTVRAEDPAELRDTLTRRRVTERHPWLYPLAVRVHQARRHLDWATSGTRWASRSPGGEALPVRVKKHGSLLLRELSPDE